MLGQPNRIGILRVPGFHGANDQEACLDWLDIQFGRSHQTWTNNLSHERDLMPSLGFFVGREAQSHTTFTTYSA